MSKANLYKIPDIIVAYVFSLIVNNYSSINYNDNKDTVLTFIRDAICEKFIAQDVFKNKSELEKHYCLKNYETCILATIPSRDTLIKDNLMYYLSQYSNDGVISDEEQVIKWSYQVKIFEDSIDKSWILSNVIINSIEHLPVIAKGYFDGKIGIKCIEFNIGNVGNKDNPLYIKSREYIGLHLNKNFNDYKFFCTIDLTNYDFASDKRTLKTQSKKLDAIKNNFTKSDFKLLRLIQERIKTGNDSVITFDDIEQIYSMRNDKNSKTPVATRVSNIISKLNTRFKKMSGKKILELQEPYDIQTDELNLSYNGLDYEITATLEDITIALKYQNNHLE